MQLRPKSKTLNGQISQKEAVAEMRRRFDIRCQNREGRVSGSPKPTPNPINSFSNRPTATMQSMGVRKKSDGEEQTVPIAGGYRVGDRVEHPKFGVGEVRAIETLASDHKLTVDFGTYGAKTLLAKFAKLTKL